MDFEFATRDKVADGFKAVGERFDANEVMINEFKTCIEQIQVKLRQLLQTRGWGDSFKSNSFWGNEDYAREFGQIVLSVSRGQTKDLGERTDALGGVLVPDNLSRRLIDLLGSFGKFRKNALVFPLGPGTTLVPKLESDLTVVCPGEGKEIKASDMLFSAVKMLPKTWGVLAAVSNELDDDALVAIGEIAGMSIVRSMARKEDEVGFLGDGTEEYFGHCGILGEFKRINEDYTQVPGLVAKNVDNWGQLTLDDFNDVITLLDSQFDDAAKWYCTKAFYRQVMYTLAASQGDVGLFELLSGKRSLSFMGYPVELVHAMPKAVSEKQVPCLLGDLKSGAYLGQRKDLSIAQSREVLFTRYMTAILGIERIDVQIFGCGDKNNPGPIAADKDGKFYFIGIDLIKAHKRYYRIKQPHVGDGTMTDSLLTVIALGVPNRTPLNAADAGCEERVLA